MPYLTADDRFFGTTLDERFETMHDEYDDTYSVDDSVPPEFYEDEDEDDQ